MTAVRDVVRLAAVRTSRAFPFGAVTRWPYTVAIRAFVRFCTRFAEIRSVYLRDGLTRDGWVPGLSDVDCTVVLRAIADPRDEHTFLVSFWRGFAALKRVFPMLGEIDVLPATELVSWSRLSIRGYESRDWRRLAGSDVIRSHYSLSPERLAVDATDHALFCYVNLLSRRAASAERSRTLRRFELARLSLKIRRYAALAQGAGKDAPGMKPPSAERSVARALTSLDTAVRTLGFGVARSADEKAGDDFRLPLASAAERDEGVPGVAGIIGAFGGRLALLEEGLDEEATARAIAGVHRLPPTGAAPVVVTPAVFGYWLRVADPLLHSRLRRSGRITNGNEVRLPPVPAERAVARSILGQGPNVLAFARSRESIEALASERACESLVERALYIRLLGERGKVPINHRELAAAAANHYGKVLSDLDELRRRTAANDRAETSAIRLDWFRLFRAQAEEVGAMIEQSAIRLGPLASEVLARTVD